MQSPKYCMGCGNKLEPNSRFCNACGVPVGANSSLSAVRKSPDKSEKSGLMTFLLCLFFGSLGFHRFYVGKIGTGILMLLTGGGFGLWYLYDLISIVSNNFSDKNGKTVEISKNPSAAKKILMVLGAIFAGFMVLFVSVAIFLALFVGGLSDVAQRQLAAIRLAEFERAYSYTSQDFQRETSFKEFKNFIKLNPILKDSDSATFPEREVQNNIAVIRGTLHFRDGSTAPIAFELINEDQAWKILGIDIHPARVRLEEKPLPKVLPLVNQHLSKIYDNTVYNFSINYPEDWSYDQSNPQTVDFSWKKGSRPYYSVVNVQVVPTKEAGGSYANVKEVIESLKKEIAENTSKVKFLASGTLELPKNPKKFQGEYFIVTYSYQGQAIKKIQYILMEKGSRHIYSWSYTAAEDNYEDDLPLAKAMYKSWQIK